METVKQIQQNLSSGDTSLLSIPVPNVGPNQLLIKAKRSLISIGTEKMLVEFGQANLINKARQQPEKVKEVLNKITTDGVSSTLDAVRSKLDQPLPLGYCHVGEVIGVGRDVSGYKAGDRVASNGSHASVVAVPQNLCAKIPDAVDDEAATFTVLGAIGLQGVRLIQPTIGENIVVTGLGLIGLLTVQILRANGCNVLGIDFDESKLELARQFGAETVSLTEGTDPVAVAMSFSQGRGVDGVIVTASTQSSEPISQAANMLRKRGRIVLVGVTGLKLNRSEFYEKEISFQVSCSYGPGRYDEDYEQNGNDYPLGFVRWTAQRNFEAILDLIAQDRLQTASLVNKRVPFDDAPAVYKELGSDKSVLGVVLEYPERGDAVGDRSDIGYERTVPLYPDAINDNASSRARPAPVSVVAGFVGAGNYASRVLIPAFKSTGATLQAIASSGGTSASHHGKKQGFKYATSDIDTVFSDSDTNTVVIATRHNTHAQFVKRALEAGKHVFVEKPLAISLEELDELESVYREQSASANVKLMVGFNRRFSTHVKKMKSLLANANAPAAFIMTVNAGAIPADHWTQDPQIGGGRVIGEGCHFVDLLRFLAGAPISEIHARSMGKRIESDISEDKCTISLVFENGAIGTIHYLANGSNRFPKETLDVFCDGRILRLNNFRSLTGYDWPGFKKLNLWKQDKGQANCVTEFTRSIDTGGATPIPAEQLFEVSRATIIAAQQIWDSQ